MAKKRDKATVFNNVPFCFTLTLVNCFLLERQPSPRTIKGRCRYDAGQCPVGTCRPCLGQALNDTVYHVCPIYSSEDVDCDHWGVITVRKVKCCSCCETPDITVKGVVSDANGTRLPDKAVWLNGGYVGITDVNGAFQSSISPSYSSQVLTIKVADTAGMYADAVKSIDIAPGFLGPVKVKIPMVKRAKPTFINPTSANKLPLSDRAIIKFEAGSITDRNGKPYTQKVGVQLTSIDVSVADNDDVLPGRFLTSDGSQLVSDLVFEPVITGEDGERLNARAIISVNAGMRLWTLDGADGRWIAADAKPVSERRRRQIQLTDEYLTNLMSGNWYNIDKIPGAPRCYFKARVYYDNPAEATYPVSFQPTVVAFTPNNQRLRLYHQPTSNLESTCFEVRCLDFNTSDPTNVLTGLISLTSYQTVDVGGATIPVVTNLQPKALNNYIPPIEAAHSSVFYEVLPNDEQVFINFITADDYSRPFYITQSICEASNPAKPAFHFLKPELPSYVAAPDNTPLCTARILLVDGYNFITTLTSLGTPFPTVTATSVWTTASGNFFYHTDSATIELSQDGLSAFVCVTFPCSTPVANTTVYLDIDIPMVVTPPSTDSAPAFYCHGGCVGTLCNQQTSIDGSFVALVLPATGGSGPDWFSGPDHPDCDNYNTTDSAAYTFKCWVRQVVKG